MVSVQKSDGKLDGQVTRDHGEVEPRIEVRNLYKFFGGDPQLSLQRRQQGYTKETLLAEMGVVLGVDDVSLKIPAGAISVIMGLSGSGKSTLARCINRILEPDAGHVLLDGKDITSVEFKELRDIRRHRISMVFQNFGLFPNKTVIDNVAFGLKIRGVGRQARRRKAGEVLEVVGLSSWASYRPRELSGGMRQRVGLARALATDADILIMDEAFSALDPLIRSEMQIELLRLQESLHKTVLFITHDFHEALRIGTRIAIMSNGAVVREGLPQDIVTDPRNDYVAEFTRNVDRARLFDARSVMLTEADHDFILDEAGRVQGHRNSEGVSRNFVTVKPDDKLLDIARGVRVGQPILVLDEDGRYCGHIPMHVLVAGIAGSTGSELAESGSRTPDG